MNKNRTKLNATIKEIVNADDKYQAKNAMKKLAHLLGMKSLTDADRKKALLTMRQHMREEILTHAEAHIIANPTLYPGYSKVLLEEIKTLKESYNAPEATQSDIERYYDLPGLDSIEKKTGKSIRDFFTYVYSFFADNGMRDEGKKYARFLSEQEVITLYISVFSSQAGIS